VNENLARLQSPGQDPVGRHLALGRQTARILAVFADIHDDRSCGARHCQTAGCSTRTTRFAARTSMGKLLGDTAAVSALLERLLHHAHVLKCRPCS
jgi:hypothetical protein